MKDNSILFQVNRERNQCKDFVDFGYFCVPFYQCDEESLIRIDGSTLLDPRLGDVDCEEGKFGRIYFLVG